MISEVFNIDCLEYMKGLPDKFFELAIVDPPYGIKEDGRAITHRAYKKDGSRRLSGTTNGAGAHVVKAPTYKIGNWDNSQPKQEYFDELFRVSKNQIIWGVNYIKFTQKDSSSGVVFWYKDTGGSDFSDGELAWTNKHIGVRYFMHTWSGFRQGDMKNKETRIHPTQKPVALYKWLLQNYAKQGDKIFDSHMGRQSSRLAAYEMGFDYYGCELDKDYFDSGNKRFEDFRKQQSLFAPQELSPVSLGGNLFANDGNKPNKTLK